MKKTNHLKILKVPVDEVWEARLTDNIWKRVAQEAEKRKSTYSWVVRYCLFRLIGNIESIGLENLYQAKCECKQLIADTDVSLHRMQLCLYGADAKLLRTVSIEYGLSVTMLIRIALLWYLHKLEGNQVSKAVFYWYGIKFIAQASVMQFFNRARPISWYWGWQSFSKESYFGMPEPNLGVYHDCE